VQITNICKPIFLTYGRIGAFSGGQESKLFRSLYCLEELLEPKFAPRVEVRNGPLTNQGCEMVSFQTKKSEFGYILESLAM
jgi:hypothetical protein